MAKFGKNRFSKYVHVCFVSKNYLFLVYMILVIVCNSKKRFFGFKNEAGAELEKRHVITIRIIINTHQ